MLALEGVFASYGPVEVLFDINLEVGEDDIVALLGTNGAGKTTILRVISGLLRTSRGTVTFDGDDITGAAPAEIMRRGIVQVPGGRGVFPGMTVQENLEVGGFLYGKDQATRDERIARVLDLFPVVAARRNRVAGSMSGGEQQMLTLAKAFVLDPSLLLIDELSLGLAPKIVDELLDTLLRFNAEGVAIMLIDQHVDLALDVATHAYFLERGQVRFSGPSQELHGRDDLLRSVFLSGATAATE